MPKRTLLRGFFLDFFLAFFLLCFFHMLFQLGALFGPYIVALLALFVELLFGAQQFDESLLGPVALLEAGAHDAQIAALAVAVTRRYCFEEPLDGLIGHEKAEGLTARVQIAILTQCDHFFNQRTNSLGLGHGGLHAIFHDDGRDQIAQEGATMAGVSSELESCIAMAHGKTLFR
jgi:hypothetical protein